MSAWYTQGHIKEWEARGSPDKRILAQWSSSWETRNGTEVMGQEGEEHHIWRSLSCEQQVLSLSRLGAGKRLWQGKQKRAGTGREGKMRQRAPHHWFSDRQDRKHILDWIPTGCRGRGKGKRIWMFLLPSEQHKKHPTNQKSIHTENRRCQHTHIRQDFTAILRRLQTLKLQMLWHTYSLHCHTLQWFHSIPLYLKKFKLKTIHFIQINLSLKQSSNCRGSVLLGWMHKLHLCEQWLWTKTQAIYLHFKLVHPISFMLYLK